MDWEKYSQVPTEFATAREIGLAAATLGAMARRGFVEVLDTSPKQYRKIDNPAIKIYQLYDQYQTDYFTVFKKDKKIGMLCSMSSSNTVLDCWGNPYDLTDTCRVEFNNKISFNL